MADAVDAYDRTIGEGLTLDEQIEDLPGQKDPKQDSVLDGDKTRKRFRQVLGWWEWVRSTQAQNRLDRIKAHNYYDNIQWDEADKSEVEARGQKACVFNIVANTVDWITGTEKRTRIDWRVLPRRREHAQDATTKTKAFKFVADVNKAGFERSLAFQDAVVSGLGWIEHGIRTDPSEEPVFYAYEDWRNIWHDTLSTRMDMQDSRFVFRRKWVDLDVATAMFPDRAWCLRSQAALDDTYFDDEYDSEDASTDLESAVQDTAESEAESEHVWNRRSRVRLIECWYRMPQSVKVVRSPDGYSLGSLEGAILNGDAEGDDAAIQALVDGGYASVFDAIKFVVRVMVFCGNHVLMDQPSPYAHNRFPFTPVWGYRRKKDGMPYGVVSRLMDPQDDLNKRRSKALFVLSSNRVVADADAADGIEGGWDEIYQEAQRPDGVIRKKRGSELVVQEHIQLGREHVMLMEQDQQYIEAAGGVTDENLGRQTNATSGRAIQARQDQGHVVTANLFDNLRLHIQISGEITLSLIEQFWTDPKTVRLTGDKGQLDFVDVNQPGPEGEIENDITATQGDFIVDEQNYSASIRQAMFQTMGELVAKMDPEIGMVLLDLWIDLSDLPGKDVMVERIRKVSNQPDPAEDENSPEAKERIAAEAQAERFRADMERELARLELEERSTANDEKKAKIKEIMAKIDKLRSDMRVASEKMDLEEAKAANDFVDSAFDRNQRRAESREASRESSTAKQ